MGLCSTTLCHSRISSYDLLCVCVNHSAVSDSSRPHKLQPARFSWQNSPEFLTEFSRQEYWSRLPLPSPEDLPDPGIKSWSPVSQADSLPFELQGSPDLLKCPSHRISEFEDILDITSKILGWPKN